MNRDWLTWTARACCRIRLGYDRRAAQRELLAHLEDEALALMESGFTQEQAQKKALAAMGDAEEVSRQLAAVHRPWLGYLWIWSRRALIACAVVAVLAAFGFADRVGFSSSPGQNAATAGEDGPGWQRAVLLPDCTDESDGYTFTVPTATKTHHKAHLDSYEYEGVTYERVVEGHTALTLTVRAATWLPNTEDCDAFWYFYAVDDRSNYYWNYHDPDMEYVWQYERSLVGTSHLKNLWTSEWTARIYSIDPAAQWIELRYDRDGRDVRLRIDLTGGEGL